MNVALLKKILSVLWAELTGVQTAALAKQLEQVLNYSWCLLLEKEVDKL